VVKLSDFVQVKDAASLLGVSADTIRRWDRAGKLTAARHPINNYRLYKLSDLESILKDLNKQTGALHE
jgi:excisionase family DNA binding protein